MPLLLVTSTLLFLPVSRAQHESEFVCINPLVDGDCARVDRSEDVVDDEQTLLDVFGEVAKEFLTNRVVSQAPERLLCFWLGRRICLFLVWFPFSL